MYDIVLSLHVVMATLSLMSMAVLVFQSRQHKPGTRSRSIAIGTFMATTLSGFSLLAIGADVKRVCPALGTYTTLFIIGMAYAHFARNSKISTTE